MNNFQYQNIDDILSSKQSIRGTRYIIQKNRRIIVPQINTIEEDASGVKKDSFELHVFYNDGGYIGSKYDINNWMVDNEQDPTNINLNILDDLNYFSLSPGSYRVVYNFFRNYISSEFNRTKLFIAEISNDRKELVLALTDPNDTVQIEKLKSFVLDYLQPKTYFSPIVLNFGENKIIDVINVTSDGSETYFYVKLFYPLPSDLGLRFECWVATQILKPYIDRIEIPSNINDNILPENILRGPNYNADYNFSTINETDYKSWNDLLSTNLQTSQEILNKYVNGDNKPIKLNIDFSSFSNFCFYSSAKERLDNFLYKIQLLEYYRDQISKLSSYIGSYEDINANKIKIKNLHDKVIEGFDEWEKWLYYEDFNYDPFITETNVITPYPKYSTNTNEDLSTKSGKYKFWLTTEDPAQRWYNATSVLAEEFDNSNLNSLYKVLPSHIVDDEQNEQFISFVNMIGQHFDVLYTYTNHILKKNLREENPSFGISQDLIQTATQNLGWTLSSNAQNKDLWEYALGLDSNNDNKYNILGQKYNKTEEERTKEVWRRILNNLPYIYRTKGTARGIKALLSAYGIPQTLLTIREYGGAYNPNSYDLGKNVYEKSTYFLNFKGTDSNLNQHIDIPWEKINHNYDWKYPDTVSFRWKMEPEKFYNYAGNEIQTILQKSSSNGIDWFVTVNKNGTDIGKGSLTFYLGDGTNYASASIIDEYLFDDIPLNLMIRRNYSTDNTSSNQQYDFILKTEKYGKILIDKTETITVNATLSSSYNNAWSTDGILSIGSGSNIETNKILSGSVFELRYWSNPLSTSSFDNHVLAARSYNGNTPTSSFYDLQAQFKFWQYFNPAITSSISSSHPDQKNNSFYSSSKTANLYSFTTSSFEAITEVYTMDTANIGANTDYFQKIRIDSSSLSGALSPHNSYEKTSLQMNSADSNRLMVAFSPQHIINEDIYEAIGDVDLSEYIGSYSNIESEEYTQLNQFAREYWQKYNNRNDFNAYISLISQFDLSVFDQIKQTLPARTNDLLGLVIEPNILERSKVAPIKKMSADTTNFVNESMAITQFPNNISTSYDTKNTVLFLGFEEGDLIDVQMIDSSTDIKTIVNSETDEKIKQGELDVNLKSKGNIVTKTTTISSPFNNPPKMDYKSYGSLLKTNLLDDAIGMETNIYTMPLNVGNTKNILGETLNLKGFAKLDLMFNSSGSLPFMTKSYYNQISFYESDVYYESITPYTDNIYIKNIGYTLTSGSIFKNPKYFETAKQSREFVGCNDYPYPYKNSLRPESTLYNVNSNELNYSLIRENYEKPTYQFNNYSYLAYTNVEDYNNNVLEYNIFPSSSFWKTDIRGNFLDGDLLKNIYGMIHTAPRIIKLDTADPNLANKKLFSPQYLQESVISGTKKYLNYPTSQDYIRGFPWVLSWSGSQENIPNLGPDLGFTAGLYIAQSQNAVITPSVNPQFQG